MSRPLRAVSYRAVLAAPGVLRVFPAATVARLSYALVPLALLLTVQRATSSYAAAGSALGVYGLASIAMPLKARLVDRFGQRAVLPALSIVFAAALASVAVAGPLGVRAASAFVLLAALAGLAAPPLGPAMRALWAALAPDPAARQRAYSLDGVVEEALYAVGPLGVGLVVAVSAPAAALAVAAVLNVAGTCVMATSRVALEHGRPRRRERPRSWLGPFRSRAFLLLAVVMVAVGLGSGPLEVAVAARAEQMDQPGLAGLLFALLAIGSVVGGLVWGRLHHRRPLPTQLSALAALSAACCLATALADPVALLGIALVAVGAVSAPIFTVAYVGSDRFAPTGAQTEASTWITTAANLGIGAGSSLAGVLLDRVSPAVALALAAVPLGLAAVVALAALHEVGSIAPQDDRA